MHKQDRQCEAYMGPLRLDHHQNNDKMATGGGREALALEAKGPLSPRSCGSQITLKEQCQQLMECITWRMLRIVYREVACHALLPSTCLQELAIEVQGPGDLKTCSAFTR